MRLSGWKSALLDRVLIVDGLLKSGNVFQTGSYVKLQRFLKHCLLYIVLTCTLCLPISDGFIDNENNPCSSIRW